MFVLIPVADAEGDALLAQLVIRLRRNVKTRPLSLKLIAKCEGAVLDGSGRVAGAVLRRCSLFEVTAALVLLLELATPRRNPILVLLYWQYLQMRCLLERATAGGAAASASCQTEKTGSTRDDVASEDTMQSLKPPARRRSPSSEQFKQATEHNPMVQAPARRRSASLGRSARRHAVATFV